MTPAEALQELGLSGPPSKAEVRKAYLRLLKTRSPERDRDAFIRLREAYEVATALLVIGGAVPPDAPASTAPSTAPPSAGTDDGSPSSEAPPDAPLGTSRAEPPAPLVRALVVDGERLFVELGARGAQEYVAAALDEALSNPGAPLSIHPLLALEAILRLQELGDVEGSRRILVAIRRWLEATGREPDLLRGPGVLWWSVARELDAIGEVPLAVKAPIACAARFGQLHQAVSYLVQFRAFQPQAAAAAAETLQARAPWLHGAYGRSLRPAPPAVSRRLQILVVVMVGGMVLLGVVSGFLQSHHASVDPTALTDSRRKARVLMDAAGTGEHRAIGVLADRVAYSIARSDCEAARAAMDEIWASIPPGASGDPMRGPASSLGWEVRFRCAVAPSRRSR